MRQTEQNNTQPSHYENRETYNARNETNTHSISNEHRIRYNMRYGSMYSGRLGRPVRVTKRISTHRFLQDVFFIVGLTVALILWVSVSSAFSAPANGENETTAQPMMFAGAPDLAFSVSPEISSDYVFSSAGGQIQFTYTEINNGWDGPVMQTPVLTEVVFIFHWTKPLAQII